LDPDHDAVAANVTDGKGCYVSSALPGLNHRVLSVRTGYTPNIGLVRTAGGDIVAPLGELVISTAFGLHKTLFIPDREEADARNAVFVAFEACQPPIDPVMTAGPDVCFGRGVEGVQGELLDISGNPIVGPAWAAPLYFGQSVGNPEQALTHTSKNAAGYFYNVPPGRYSLRLRRSDGGSMSCTPHAGSLLALGWPAKEPNTYVAVAEAGFNNFVVRAFCELN